MGIKDIIGRGLGYSSSTYWLFTHGLNQGPGVVAPFTPGPNSGILKKFGAGSLLKVGTHLAKDLECCCGGMDPDCLGRTGKEPNQITVELAAFSNGSFSGTPCDCTLFGGTYILTPGGACCPYCGGTYSDVVPMSLGCMNALNWNVGRVVAAQLSAIVPPSLPTGICPDMCGQLVGPVRPGCNYHKDDPSKRPDLRWWVQFEQKYLHEFNSSNNFSWTAVFFSDAIPYDVVNNNWPILGTFSLTKITYLELPCSNAQPFNLAKLEDDPYPSWQLETCHSTTCTLTAAA